MLEGAQAGLSWTIVLEDRYLAPATPELRQTLRKRGIPYDGGIRGFGICANVELARAFMVIKDVRKNRERKHYEHDSGDHCRHDQDIFHLCTNAVKSDLQNYQAENDLR